MTLMGQKRTKNAPLKPAGRRTAGEQIPKATTEEVMEYEAFMVGFRGKPCERCGKTEWSGYPTVAHHILSRSTYPEHTTEVRNAIALCPVHHSMAHSDPVEFLVWLKMFKPETFEWVESNRHHRKQG